MKICVASFGSDGDIQPYLALSKALKAAGHDVFFHTMDRYQARIEKLGLRFHLMAKWKDEEAAKLGPKMLATRNPTKHLKLLYDALLPDFLDSIPRAKEAVAEADLIVNHVINIPVAAEAELQKKPIISGHLFPNVIPSPYIGPLGSSGNTFINRGLWFLVRTLLRSMDNTINPVYQAVGLPPKRDIMIDSSHSKLLNLVALSPRLLPTKTGWAEHYKVTGYWFLDEPDYTPESSLTDFLKAGEPPVLITFGSMTGMDVARQNKTLLEGVIRSGKRAIFQSGWAGFGEGQLPPPVYRAGVVPHSWLLRHVAGIIHHGGAGTTAASYRVGIPQGIVWHLGDQSSWGAQAKSLGVGVSPIWYGKLSASWVESAVRRFTEDKEMQQKAKTLGAEIRAENGLQEAVRLIEEVGRAR